VRTYKSAAIAGENVCIHIDAEGQARLLDNASGKDVCGAPPQTALKPMIEELENRQTARFL